MRRGDSNMTARGGPLMTNHLHDLELELELLKRKRQLIQQQQSEMLYRAPESRLRYDQPQRFNDHFNEPQQRNLSHLYDESIRDSRPFVPKRRAEPWAAGLDDRFDGSASAYKKPRQSLFPSPFMNQNRSQPFQRPKPNPPPSLLDTPRPLMSLAPRGSRRPPQPQFTRQYQSARPTRPTVQTNFKRNTNQFGKPGNPDITPKNVGPINKSVSSVSPKKVDQGKKEVVLSDTVEPSTKVLGRLELALGTVVKDIKSAHAGKRGLFGSPALARLMKQCIRERLRSVMVGKVVGTVTDILAEYRNTFPPSTDVEILDLAVSEKLKQEQKGELAIQLLEAGNPEEYFKKNMTNLLNVKLGEMFRKMEKIYEDQTPTLSEILTKVPEIKKTPDDNSLTDDGQEKQRPMDIKPSPKEVEFDKWMSLLLERKLPQMLARKKYEIIKALDLDQMFRNTKAAIIINTNNQSLNMVKNRKPHSRMDSQTESPTDSRTDTSKYDPELPRSFFYYAKVHAIPSMPKRKLMQEFLNGFKPKTIKRHKKNINLLFVGFNDKADYDKILAANQTTIGNATLNIVGNVPKQEEQIDNTLQALDDVLTPQLDDQINDLLSSIRKADEEAKANEDEPITDTAVEHSEIQIKPEESGNDSDVQEVEAIESTADVVSLEDDEVPHGEETKQDVADDKKINGNKAGNEEANGNEDVVTIEDDEVAPLKSEGTKVVQATPAKARAPATPNTIRTRRASRLAQNN